MTISHTLLPDGVTPDARHYYMMLHKRDEYFRRDE